MQASLKTSFAQISRAAQKIWVAQNLGGLQPHPPRRARPVRLCSVAQFASEIRKLCLRLNLLVEESVHLFIKGLKPELKNYVVFTATKNIFRSIDVRKT